jgi:MFS family permease
MNMTASVSRCLRLRRVSVAVLLLLLLPLESSSGFLVSITETISSNHKSLQHIQMRASHDNSRATQQVRLRRRQRFLLYSSKQNEASDPKSIVAPLALLCLSQFILYIGVGAVLPSIPLYGRQIGLGSAANGIVISAPAVALLLGANYAGKYADTARKPAMLWGMAVICVSDLATAYATGVVALLIARLGLGAGRCLSESGERGMLADIVNQAPHLRGRALACQQAVAALGIAIGAPLGGMIVDQYSVRATFLCVSAAAVISLLLYSFLPETIGLEDKETINKPTGARELAYSTPNRIIHKQRKDSLEGDWSSLLSNDQWRGLALCQCGASFGFACKISSVPLLATTVLPGGSVGAGALISAAGLSGLVGAPIGGWLTDRVGARLTTILSGAISATSLMLVPVTLSLSNEDYSETSFPIVGSLTTEAAAFAVLIITWSIGAAAQGPALTAIAQQLAPVGAEATALALPRAAGDGTYIFAPFILGLVTDAMSNTPGIECAVAGTAILCGVLALARLDK